MTQPEIFTLTIAQKALTNGVCSLVLNGSSVFVDTKKISTADLKSDYILILNGYSSLIKNAMYGNYNGDRRRDVTLTLFCVSKSESSAMTLAGKLDYYLAKNQHLLSKEGLRCAQVINNGKVPSSQITYSGVENEYAYMLTYRGFVIF